MQSRGIKDNKIVPKTRERYAARKEIYSHRGVFFLINWLLHIFKYSLFTQSVEKRARFALIIESCVELLRFLDSSKIFVLLSSNISKGLANLFSRGHKTPALHYRTHKLEDIRNRLLYRFPGLRSIHSRRHLSLSTHLHAMWGAVSSAVQSAQRCTRLRAEVARSNSPSTAESR